MTGNNGYEKNLPKVRVTGSKVGRRSHSNKNGYLFVAPYALFFAIFIMAPVVIAIGLSFTNFNTIQRPRFVGLLNYINLITSDDTFMKFVLPNGWQIVWRTILRYPPKHRMTTIWRNTR